MSDNSRLEYNKGCLSLLLKIILALIIAGLVYNIFFEKPKDRNLASKKENLSQGQNYNTDLEKDLGLIKNQIEDLKKENENLHKRIENLENMYYENEDSKEEEKTANQTKEIKLNPGEVYEIEGVLKFSLNDAYKTSERLDDNDYEPAEVVVISYSYENISYENKYQNNDLYIFPSSVVDDKGVLARDYFLLGLNPPKFVSQGSKVSNVELAYGLKNPSDKIRVYFNIDNGSNPLGKVSYEINLK